jgi:nucleoside 2-deoxyribosyltransferase
MKIYFAGSIRAGREEVATYAAMIDFLGNFGEVLTAHVGDFALTDKGDEGPNDRRIHDRDMAWLKRCDVVVAEVTVPSLGVGYELGWAVALNKPVLCLFRRDPRRSLSAMISGCSGIETAEYARMEEAQRHMTAFINKKSLPISIARVSKDTD